MIATATIRSLRRAGPGLPPPDGPLAVLEQLIEPAFVVDERRRVHCFNPAAQRLWRRQRDQVLGRRLETLFARAPGSGPMAPADLAGARHELLAECGDGTRRWVSLSLSRCGATYVGVARDIGEEMARREELGLLSLVAEETDRSVLVTDDRCRVVYVNRAFVERFGHAREAVVGRCPIRLLAGPHTDSVALQRIRGRAGSGCAFQEEVLAYARDGEEVWVSASVHPAPAPDGRGRQVVVLADVTESRRMQGVQRDVFEALANDRPLKEVMALICARIEAIAPDALAGATLVDPDGRLRPLAGARLPAGYLAALDGLPVGPGAGGCATAAYRAEPVMVERIDNAPLWAPFAPLLAPAGLGSCWSNPVLLHDGRVAGTLDLYFRDREAPDNHHARVVDGCLRLCGLAIERHEARLRIVQLAYLDTLTGLPNRAWLHRRIRQCLSGARPGGCTAFLVMDLDRFKEVNDTWGHAAGDCLLVEVAQRLQRQLRPGDMVGRLGGDEFVLLLPDCDRAAAAAVGERIVAAMTEPVLVGGLSFDVSISIGISFHPEHGADADSLLKRADAAMYEAKQAGAGAYRFCR